MVDPTQQAIRMLALHLPSGQPSAPTQPAMPTGTSPEDAVLRQLMRVMGPVSAIPPAATQTTVQAILEALHRGQ